MVNKAKLKGDNFERAVKNLLEAEGIRCTRTLLPAQAGKQDPGDLLIEGTFRAECKCRKAAKADGLITISKWLGDKDFLIAKRNYNPPIVVVTWQNFINLLKDHKIIQAQLEIISPSAQSNDMEE